MILVTGVSGVGKTYTILRAIAELPQFRYLRASEVLRSLGRPITNLTAAQIAENQEVLLAALMLETDRDCRYLIVDGHAVLETASEFVPVPDHVYRDLPISTVIYIFDDPRSIAPRRVEKARSTDPVKIEELQRIELSTSVRWSETYMAGFRSVRSGDVDAFTDAVAQAIQPRGSSDR
jgi:adenylate kinase